MSSSESITVFLLFPDDFGGVVRSLSISSVVMELNPAFLGVSLSERLGVQGLLCDFGVPSLRLGNTFDGISTFLLYELPRLLVGVFGGVLNLPFGEKHGLSFET